MPVGSQSRRTTGSSYHRSGSTLPRFDSYLSLKSSMSETFFDALEVLDKCSILLYTVSKVPEKCGILLVRLGRFTSFRGTR